MTYEMTMTVSADRGTTLTLGMLREFIDRTAELDDACDVIDYRSGAELESISTTGSIAPTRPVAFYDTFATNPGASPWTSRLASDSPEWVKLNHDASGVVEARIDMTVCTFDGRAWPCGESDDFGQHRPMYRDAKRYTVGLDVRGEWWVIGPYGRTAYEVGVSRAVAELAARAANDDSDLAGRLVASDPPPELVTWAQPAEGGE